MDRRSHAGTSSPLVAFSFVCCDTFTCPGPAGRTIHWLCVKGIAGYIFLSNGCSKLIKAHQNIIAPSLGAVFDKPANMSLSRKRSTTLTSRLYMNTFTLWRLQPMGELEPYFNVEVSVKKRDFCLGLAAFVGELIVPVGRSLRGLFLSLILLSGSHTYA